MLFDFESLSGGRRFAALLFCLGVVHVACYYLMGSLAASLDLGVLPQPDVQLYLQAARRIVEGAPFSFSAGEPPCTGTTSVLYPFLLAFPCVLGAPTRILPEWGFWLNAVFYLVFLFCWSGVFTHVFERPRLTGFWATLLLGLSGQPICCALSQSDVGLWMAASSMFVWALMGNRRMLAAGLALLAPWIRPEGVVLTVALILMLTLSIVLPIKFKSQRFVGWLIILGCVGMFGVLTLNHALSGTWQFSSIANKGHFVLFPFAEAVHRMLVDLLTICRGLFCGQAFVYPRANYMMPVLGPVLFWTGVFVHDWRHRSSAALIMYLIASIGGVFSVAISGWQGSNVDRYLAWVQPALVLFEAEGAVFFAVTIARRSCAAACLVLLVPFAFTTLAAVDFLMCYHLAAADGQRFAAFSSAMDVELPATASVGTVGHCGLAFRLGNRRLAHLGGIYSPEFRARTVYGNLSLLKREPSLRFSHWLFAPDDVLNESLAKGQGPTLLHGPDGIELRQADWAPFDRAAVAPNQLAIGRRLVCYVDIGCDLDERDSDYEVLMRNGEKPFGVFGCFAELGGKTAFDTGRVVCGCDELEIELETGKDVLVVMRTLRSANVNVPSRAGYSTARGFVFGEKIRLQVAVNGVLAASPEFALEESGFIDASFELPGNLIGESRTRISFLGDHIACGYWFYQ
jgi:hypothetical protein